VENPVEDSRSLDKVKEWGCYRNGTIKVRGRFAQRVRRRINENSGVDVQEKDPEFMGPCWVSVRETQSHDRFKK